MQALRVRELRTVPGFEWTRVTQRKVPAKAVLVNVNLKNQTKFSESVATLQQVLGNRFVFFSETPYGGNNSYVRHSVGLDVI